MQTSAGGNRFHRIFLRALLSALASRALTPRARGDDRIVVSVVVVVVSSARHGCHRVIIISLSGNLSRNYYVEAQDTGFSGGPEFSVLMQLMFSLSWA